MKKKLIIFDLDGTLIDTLSDISSETCSKSNDVSYCKICDPKCKYLDCICAESWKSFDETLENHRSGIGTNCRRAPAAPYLPERNQYWLAASLLSQAIPSP